MAAKGNYKDAPWLLFFFLPIGAAVASLRNFRASWSKNLFWAFVVFYGATYAIATEDRLSTAPSDIHRYAMQLSDFYKLHFTYDDILKLYADNPDFDILKLTIAIILSRFTDSLQALTVVYAFIYGYFLSRNLWLVFNNLQGKLKPSVKFLLAVLFLILPFWFITGFRFWTATQIFIYGVYLFFFKKQKYGLGLASLSILVHFSFIYAIIAILLYLVIGKRTLLLFIIYMTSLFYSQLDITVFNTFLEQYASEKLQERTEGYRDEDRVELYRKGELIEAGITANWYAKYYNDAFIWVMRLMVPFLYIRMRRYFNNDKQLKGLFAFTLLFFSLSNFLSSLPSAARWLTPSCFFTMTCIILLRQNSQLAERKMNRALLIASPLILLFLVVCVRTGVYSLSINTFLGNPFTALLTDFNISINDLLK